MGGLFFCSKWNYTRWRVAREDGHRLYFRAVFFGALIFAFVAWLQPHAESYFPSYARAVASAKNFVKPMAKDKVASEAVADLSIICFISMLAGLPLAWLCNLFFWKNYWLRRALRKDVIEAFLLSAVDKEASIAVTMDDQKVYVGYVVESSDPTEDRKCIRLLPLMSGYRTEETHKVTFTTFYADLYGRTGSTDQGAPLPTPLEHLTPEDFITLLPVDRISSYRQFDVSAYRRFQRPPPPAEPPQAQPVPDRETSPV